MIKVSFRDKEATNLVVKVAAAFLLFIVSLAVFTLLGLFWPILAFILLLATLADPILKRCGRKGFTYPTEGGTGINISKSSFKKL